MYICVPVPVPISEAAPTTGARRRKAAVPFVTPPQPAPLVRIESIGGLRSGDMLVIGVRGNEARLGSMQPGEGEMVNLHFFRPDPEQGVVELFTTPQCVPLSAPVNRMTELAQAYAGVAGLTGRAPVPRFWTFVGCPIGTLPADKAPRV